MTTNMVFVFNTLKIKKKIFYPEHKEQFVERSESEEECDFKHRDKKVFVFCL